MLNAIIAHLSTKCRSLEKTDSTQIWRYPRKEATEVAATATKPACAGCSDAAEARV